MGRAENLNMDVEERSELLHKLELQHQEDASQSELLNKDEDARRLRVRILMLRDENTSLREQIAENNDLNAKLNEKCDDYKSQIQSKIDLVSLQEKQLQKQEREFSNLKTELQSMNSAAHDSSSVLTEKLALTRELAVLKPELDHLRSQVNHQQSVLAEKLSLERQVNTLEVELANEKKASKRAMASRESNDRVEDELRQKLREAEKKLIAEKTERERLEDLLEQEKRARSLALQDQDSTRDLEGDLRKKLQDYQRQLRTEKAEREKLEEELQAERLSSKKSQKKVQSHQGSDDFSAELEDALRQIAALKKEKEKAIRDSQMAVEEAQTRNDTLEQKLEKMKAKLRDVQAELKQSQADLQKAPVAQPSRLSPEDESTPKAAGRPQVVRKRKAQEISAEEIASITSINIGTPGVVTDKRSRTTARKRAMDAAMVGKKSDFSITPLLNRTKDVIEGSPHSGDSMTPISQPSFVVRSSSAARSPEPVAPELIFSDPPSKAVQPTPQPKTRGRPRKVLGEAPSAKKNSQAMGSWPLGSALKPARKAFETIPENTAKAAAPAEKGPSVKFDLSHLPQDNSISSSTKGDEPKMKKRKVLGSTKTLFDDEEGEPAPVKRSGKMQLGGKAATGATRSAFGSTTFSPLKRTKRGVNASFLA